MDVMTVLKNKKQRNIIILSILTVLLTSILLYQLTHKELPPPPGAKRVVICTKCTKVDLQRVSDIKKAKCKFCGAPVVFAWKCEKCKYEFGLDEKKLATGKKTTMERFQEVVNVERCPNCSSTDTRPMTIQDYDKEH